MLSKLFIRPLKGPCFVLDINGSLPWLDDVYVYGSPFVVTSKDTN